MDSIDSKTQKELVAICKGDKIKYKGYSKNKKKKDLHDFIIKMNAAEEELNLLSEQFEESNDEMGEILGNMFAESDESINKLFRGRPEKENIDEIVETIDKKMKNKHALNTAVFDSHDDEGNGNMYRMYKHNYYQKYETIGSELILYHGTDKKNIPDILEYGFSLTVQPKHGVLYGKGIYFTNCIDKALTYSERTKTEKYVIVCVVHIGDIINGNAQMNMHPKMPNKNKKYDTSVDCINNPIQYIKKENFTYNIIGVLTFKLYNAIVPPIGMNLKLIIKNCSDKDITIYWIPTNIQLYDPDIIKKGKFMNKSATGNTWSCKTCKLHNFIIVSENTIINYINIRKDTNIKVLG